MTHEEMVRRADEIGQASVPLIPEAERAGGFGAELRDAVHAAEIHKLLRPKRYGGFGMGP
ncbi:MAG TPA: acyl-CoA dehydrogenase, partial [Gammaproteobacteria bacterium]|nr:acyl-CoA dehydrogenase [Gammaproteobacteria bacterium]